MRIRLRRVATGIGIGLALFTASVGIPVGHALALAQLSVGPRSGLLDVSTHLVISGLSPRQHVTVAVSSIDAHGLLWSSQATFVADGNGRVDPQRIAPVSGSYQGVDPMGLFDTLTPVKPNTQDQYYWWSGATPRRFEVSVTGSGLPRLTAQIARSSAATGETSANEYLSVRGFYGVMFEPPHRIGRHPAVLIFGGSEGGLDTTLTASLLAAHGYPTLAVAYFNERGLPQSLSGIPLEYFAKALTWLAQQPEVNPSRMFVSGASRGSEAALLLGSYFPRLVYGVIANVPNNVSLCSYPGCAGAAWTLHGRPLPFTRQFDVTKPTDQPSAVIPVERIRGPIFLDCGGHDLIWDSCLHANAIKGRARRTHNADELTLLSYPGAGHGIGGLVPHESYRPSATGILASLGGTPTANHLATAALWPALLQFLHQRD